MDKDALIMSLQKANEVQAKQLAELAEQLKQQTRLLEQLQCQIEQLLRQLYGKKSEKKKKDDDNNNPPSTPSEHRSKSTNSKSNHPKRSRPPENLERINIIHDLREEEKQCLHCQQLMHCIGHKSSEQIDFIPAKLIVKHHIRYQYACRCGLGGIKIATMPNQPIDKGLPSGRLLAEILINKYQDALPLYRQALRLARHGYDCSDSTLGDWVRDSTFILEPIVKCMHQDLLQAAKIHTDDTPVPVLAKGKTKLGRLWVYLTDRGAKHKICLYDYTPSRSQQGPIDFLQDFTEYLQADAYNGYDILFKEKGMTEVGCCAHMRRKFFDVAMTAKGASHAGEIVDIIGELYEVERRISNLTNDERRCYRKRFSKPIWRKLRRKINRCYEAAIEKTPFYNALQYALNHWIALTRYLARGFLDIDNNRAERSIKPVVIGRKNYMFAGSDEGGKRAAIAYSIIETCKLNGVNTFDYLCDVLARLPNTLHKDLSTLLPYNWRQAISF